MKNLFRFLMACMFISANSLAGNYTWTGATNSSWGVSTNWSPAGTPGASDSITINSTSTNLVLTTKQTVKRLTINNDTLDLGGDTLEITGSAAFSGGKINNGVCYPQCTGLLNFNSTTFGAEVKARGQIKLNGCTFNNTAYFEHVGSAAGTGTGGNTFNGTTTLKNTGTSTLRIGQINNDVFNGNAYVISVSNNIQISYGAHTYFNGNVEFTSSTIYGINVGGTGNGYTYLAAGKTITSGGTGIIGSFVLRNFIQYGTTAQSFTSTGSLNMTTCVFNGNLTCSAQALLLSGNEFHGTTSLTKTGTSSDFSAGGNHFYSNVTFINNATNSASLRLASTNGDYFDGDATFNTSTGQIQVAYVDTSDFKGHISSNNSAKVTFGTAGGYSNFNGVNEQILSGTGEYVFSRMIVNKATSTVTLQKPIKVDTLLVLQTGIIKGDSVNKVTVGIAGSITGMSPQNYIEAAVLKIGNSAFTFPVGANGEYRPITMSAPTAATDKFEAQYFKQQQGFSSTLDTGLNYISTCNYWRFERIYGSSAVSFTTNWYDHSCDVFDVDSTKLVGYQNGVWKNLGLLNYSGNDSIGSCTYTGSLSGYKYFTYGHMLYPRLQFEASYDSTSNPVRVTFQNYSRGIPSTNYFYFLHGDSTYLGSSIDSLLYKQTFQHEYSRYKEYSTVFYSIINGDTISTSAKFSLISICTATVHYENSTPQPAVGNIISACYGRINVKIDISNLADDPLGHELEIVFPSTTLLNGIQYLPTAYPNTYISITPLAGNNGYSIDYTYTGTGTPLIYNGQIDLFFELNSCALFSSSNELLEFNFNCLSNSSLQTVNFETLAGDEFSAPAPIPGGNGATYTLPDIARPSLDFTGLNTANPNYSLYDEITREFDIVPTSGITNMFIYSFNIENEAELIGLEVVDPFGSNPPMILYDKSDPAIPGNTQYSITFVDQNLGLSFPTIPSNQAPYAYQFPGFVTHVFAYLDAALNINSSSAPFLSGLYYYDAAHFNSIRIKETLRIKNIANCANINQINNSSTSYSLGIECDKDIQTPQCNLTSRQQNLECKVLPISFSFSSKVYILGVGYINIGNTAPPTSVLTPCSPINYVLLVENTTSINNGQNPECGTVKLQSIDIEIDLKHFEYDDIYYGTSKIDPYYIQISNSLDKVSIDLVGWYQSFIPTQSPNPLFITTGVDDSFNSAYPSQGAPSEYLFLPPGGQIGFEFRNLRLKDCVGDPNYEFHTFPHIADFWLTNLAYLKYLRMCEFPVNGPLLTASTGNSTQFRNYFKGYTTSSANPLYILNTSPNSILTFEFHNTSATQSSVQSYTGTYNPWQLMRRDLPHTQVMNCTDLDYYALLTLPPAPPPPPGNPPSPSPYSITSVKVYNSQDGSVIQDQGFFITINIPGTDQWEIRWTWPTSGPTPDLKLEIGIHLACNGTEGVEDFELEFRSTCNSSCDPCFYYVYAVEKQSLDKHCAGACTNTYVTTKGPSNIPPYPGVVVTRETTGWFDEAAFINNDPHIPVNYSPDQAWHNVYPCDQIQVTSNGAIDVPLVLPAITLDGLYFDLLVSQDDIPLQATQRLFNSVAAGTNSGFWITPISGSSSCINSTFFVALKNTNIINATTTDDSQKSLSRIRFVADINTSVTCGANNVTILDILQNSRCDLLLDAHLVVEDIPFIAKYYEADVIRGLFSATDINGNLEESCDPWPTNLTYLKLNTSQTTTFSGPFSPFNTNANQCNAIFSYTAKVDGGYPSGDDFPNEFRPVLIFPSQFKINHSSDIKVDRGVLELLNGGSNIIYNPLPLSSNPPVTFVNSTTGTALGVDKVGEVERRFHCIFDRDCPLIEEAIPPALPIVEVEHICDVLQVSCGNTVSCNDEYYACSIGGNSEVFDEDILTFTFNNGTPFLDLDVPSQPLLPISLSYSNGNFSAMAPNTYLYFTNNKPGLNITYSLIDHTTGLAVPSVQALNGTVIFETGNVLKGSTENFDLSIDWSPKPYPNPPVWPCDDIVFTPHYGVSCNGYKNLINIQNSNCLSLTGEEFKLIVPDAELKTEVVSALPTSLSGCALLPIDFKLTSNKGDLNSVLFEIEVSSPLQPALGNCQYSVDGNVYANNLILPNADNIINNGVTIKYQWDVLKLIHNLPISNVNGLLDHFNIDHPINYIVFHMNFQMFSPGTSSVNVKRTAIGVATCGAIVHDPTNSLVSIPYYGNGMAPPVSIQSSGSLCNGVSNLTLFTNPLNWPGGYLWSNGSTASSIGPIGITAGTYAVTVTDGAGCSTSNIIAIIDDVPDVNLVANPSEYCVTSAQPVTITNTLDNGYLYLWSNGSSSHPVSINAANLTGSVSITGNNACTIVENYSISSFNPSVTITNVSGSTNYCPPGSGIILQASATPTGTAFSYQWSPINLNSANVIVQPISTQNYSVIVSNPNGCSASANTTINSIAPPVNILPNPAIGCTGDGIVLNASSCIGCSYAWSNNNTTSTTTITVQNPPSVLNLTVTDPATGCENYGQVSGIGITPVLSGTTVVNSTSSGSTVSLTVLNSNMYNTTYAWYDITNNSMIPNCITASCFVNPASTTQYQVAVTNTDPVSGISCTEFLTFDVLVPSTPPSLLCDPLLPDIKASYFVLNSSGKRVFNALAGVKYAVNNTLTINSGMVLVVGAGAYLEFADDVGIDVINGGELYIEFGGRLYSCNNHVWRGITCDNQSKVTLTGTSSIPLIIEDAVIALNASGPNPNISINGGVEFNANYISVFLHGGDFTNIKFQGTKFTCNKLLDTPYNGMNYSFVHLRLENAGTVNLNIPSSGATYSSYFEDAMYCIESRKTNLLIDYCSFEQSNLNYPVHGRGPIAVYFEGEDGTNPNVLYTLNAGKINSTFGKNHFSDCYWGIRTEGRAVVNIANNEFYGVRYGIGAGDNALSLLPNKAGSLHINYNYFYTILENGIDIYNNGNVYVEVGYNEINFTQAFDPSVETKRGIYVHNAVDPSNDNSNLNISYNKIKNCRTGIQIMQQSRGVIGTNDIIYELEDSYLDYSLGVFRRGIRAQNTSGLTFLDNTVSRIPAFGQTYSLTNGMIDNDPMFLNGTLICGISEEFSNNDYNSNHIFDMPTQIKVFGPCLGSSFLCNDMNNGLEGFKIEPTWIPGSATSISAQGSLTSPNGNVWQNWPSISSGLPVSKINGVLPIGAPVTWFYGNTTDQDPTFDPGGVLTLPFGLFLFQSNGTACIPCTECAIDRIYAAIADADSLEIDEAIQFVLRSYAYRELKDSLQLLYSGSVYDIELQNFFNSMGLNNVGLLSNIEELLASNDYANAALYNGDLVTDRLVETNLETVNRICASYEMKFDNLDSIDKAELETIAYQNPSIGGVAVYRARAILGIDIEDSYLAFRRPKSENKVTSIRLVPNPTSGKFTVFTTSSNFEINSVEVFNNVGQLIKTIMEFDAAGSISIDLSDKPDGTYFIKAVIAEGKEFNEKLILIKK